MALSTVSVRSGAPVTTTWQLVPPMPNDETPATFGAGQGMRSVTTLRLSSSKGIRGLGREKLRLGTSSS